MKTRKGNSSGPATGCDLPDPGGAHEPSAKTLPRWKLVLFSLLPVCALLVVAEVVVRVAGLTEPNLKTFGLMEEGAGIIGPDPDLFWSLRPNLDSAYEGVRVTSNALGLRSLEVRPKLDNELRILSLGESSTFGVGVPNDQTYTALVAELLQDDASSPRFTAFNAGVSAWSSFQSLKYLELRGLELAPDIVLFYHELNDYLPSTLRDSSNTEIGVLKTDRQLYESRIRTLARSIVNASALFRYLQGKYAHRAIQAFNTADFKNPLVTIGLPDIGIPGRLGQLQGETWRGTSLNEKSLGRRVSEDERRENLYALTDLCRSNQLALIVIHPAYRDSKRHACLLTRFCGYNDVPMFEAYNALHPPDTLKGAMFRDSWHPNVEGHRRLAEGLAELIKGIVASDE